jgi:hypothetical protein
MNQCDLHNLDYDSQKHNSRHKPMIRPFKFTFPPPWQLRLFQTFLAMVYDIWTYTYSLDFFHCMSITRYVSDIVSVSVFKLAPSKTTVTLWQTRIKDKLSNTTYSKNSLEYMVFINLSFIRVCHVVTCFGRSKPEDGPKLSPKRSVLYFSTQYGKIPQSL